MKIKSSTHTPFKKGFFMMLKWQKLSPNISQKLLEESNCRLSPSIWDVTTHNIVSIFYTWMHWAISIKAFHFVVKYFALITASWTLICCPIIGKHSNIRKYWFYAKYVAQNFTRKTFSVGESIFKFAANLRYIYARKFKCWKTPEQITSVVYFCDSERTWYCITDHNIQLLVQSQ